MTTSRLYNIVLFISIFSLLSPYRVSAENTNDEDTQTIINLLDHMYSDYPSVIKDGKILNESEYEEMQEFSRIIYNLTEKITIPAQEKMLLLSHILNLRKNIQEKASFLEVDFLFKNLKKELINATGYSAALTKTQDTNSKKEYATGSSLKIANNYLVSALKRYKEGNREAARHDALAAYLDGIEPIEAKLKTYAPATLTKLEQQMLQVRYAIEQNKNNVEVEKEINSALTLISDAREVLRDNSLNYWLTFVLSASILLREGLEAFLIIVLILALIQRSGTKKAKIWFHSGWISAIIMGVIGWFFSGWILKISGQNREIMEGFISLIAVIILAFVGFWLHNNSKAEKWKTFVEEKIGKQLQKEKMFGLAFFSFMVVFREAFESILFLQAINLETTPLNKSAIAFGVLAAFGLIGLIGILFVKYSKKIPIRQLFRYSSWGISLLAVILLGKGIHAIQESGWISITNSPIFVHIDWLGIYPTFETTISQVILCCVVLVLYYVSDHKGKLHLKLHS